MKGNLLSPHLSEAPGRKADDAMSVDDRCQVDGTEVETEVSDGKQACYLLHSSY